MLAMKADEFQIFSVIFVAAVSISFTSLSIALIMKYDNFVSIMGSKGVIAIPISIFSNFILYDLWNNKKINVLYYRVLFLIIFGIFLLGLFYIIIRILS